MAFPSSIQNALKKYDKNKGFFRRAFSPGGNAPCINKLRELERRDFKKYTFSFLKCFVTAMPKTSQASYSVFQAVAQEQFNGRLNGRLNSEKYREVLLALHKQKLFTPNNIKAITQHSYPNAFISALQMLNQASLLNQQTFNTLKNQSNPASLAYPLRILHRKKLLSATNDKTLYQYTDTELTEIAKIVRILDENNILDKKNFQTILTYANQTTSTEIESTDKMSHLSKALDIFSQKLSVNQGSFNSIIKESNPLQFAEDTYMLHTAKRLAQEVKNKSENLRVLKNKFKLFNNCTDPTEIAVIIDILNNNNLLTKENLELVSKQTNLDDLNSAIRILEENRLLDQKNFDRIIKEANRYKIAKILSFFKKDSISIEEHINFLNEEYFLALNTLYNAKIFTKENLALLKTNEGNSFSSARILTELNNAKILTEENFAKIKNFDTSHVWLVISIIKKLNQANILNDNHFDAVINCENLLEMEKQIGKLVKQKKLNNHSFQNIINEIQSLKRNKTSFDTPTSLKKTTTSPSLKAPHESVTIPDLTSDTHSSINDLHKIEEDNHSPTLENKNKAETSGLSFSGDTTQDHLIKTPPQQGNTSSSYLAMFTIPLQWLVSPIQVIKSYSLQFFASLCKFTSLYPEGQSTLAIESSEDHKQQTLALAPEDSDKDNNKPSDTTTQPHEAIIPSVSAQQKANTVELTSASTYSHDSPRFFNDQSTRNKQDPEQRETSKHISYR